MTQTRLQHLFNINQANHLIRERHLIEERNHNEIVINGKKLINFCSSDYLNLCTHDKIKQAFIDGVNQYGLGSGASAIVAGYTTPHALLEKKMAEWLERDRAILFNSGYHANLGVITTFANRNTVIIADKYCHASLIDAFLLSRSKHYRYTHQDVTQAQNLLKQHPTKNKLLVTESVFSMEGDITPLPQFISLAEKSEAMLIVDDAHALSVLGKTGGGITEHYSLKQKDIACLISPLGKGLASMGAVVSGSHDTVEALVQFARTYRYSTALPPAVCHATLMSIHLIQQETWRRNKLDTLIDFFNQQAKKHGLTLSSYDHTPIRAILIGANALTQSIQKKCAEAGFFISCIRPPTVPINTARIRISLTALHTEMQITSLLIEIEKSLCEK